MKKLLLLTVLLVPGLARAGSSVYDAGPVAIPKADYQVNPNIPGNEKIVAADWNQAAQYILDASTAIRWGYYHGLAPQTAAPGAPDSGVILYVLLTDGGPLSSGVWAKFPDAGVQQVFDGQQQMDHLWVRGDGVIDGGLTIQGTGTSAFEWTAPNIVAGTDMASAGTLESSGKATLNNVYVPGATKLDGGVDLGVGGGIANVKTISGVGTSTGIAVTANVADVASNVAFDFNNNPTNLTLSNDFLLKVRSAGSVMASLSGTGVFLAQGGFNARAGKVLELGPGTAATDGVNLGQLTASTSMAAYAPSAIAAGTALAAKTALGAGTARTLNVTRQVNGTCPSQPCGNDSNSWATYEVKDTTSGISICSVAVPSCCNIIAGSPCPAFFAQAPVTTCAGTYALSDNLQIDVTDAGSSCNGLPTAMVNFGGY